VSEDILELPAPPADARLPYGSYPEPEGGWPEQFGDLRLPSGAGPYPVVIYIHGGFWRARYDLTHAGHPCAALTAAGIATWNIEYRRIGNEGGSLKPAGGSLNPAGGWPETFLDVAAAADHVRALAPRYDLDPGRVVAVGHSAGGHLALWLAARHCVPPDSPLHDPDPLPLRAAIGIGAVTDLRLAWERRLSGGVVRELMGGTPDEVPDRYAAASPPELLPLGVPQTLIHGTADGSVPYDMTVLYADRARAAGDSVRLITLSGVDHFAPVDPRSPQWPSTLDLIKDALQLSPDE
jgi:acetyl esterase/lipase